MDDGLGPSLSHLLNHLTTIKMAVELLERRADLTEDQVRLAETAIQAADALAADLTAARRAESSGTSRLVGFGPHAD